MLDFLYNAIPGDVAAYNKQRGNPGIIFDHHYTPGSDKITLSVEINSNDMSKKLSCDFELKKVAVIGAKTYLSVIYNKAMKEMKKEFITQLNKAKHAEAQRVKQGQRKARRKKR